MQPNKPQQDRIFVGEVEAAEMLGISPRTLFTIRKAGEIPFVRIRNLIKYRIASLEKWAEEQEQLATA